MHISEEKYEKTKKYENHFASTFIGLCHIDKNNVDNTKSC